MWITWYDVYITFLLSLKISIVFLCVNHVASLTCGAALDVVRRHGTPNGSNRNDYQCQQSPWTHTSQTNHITYKKMENCIMHWRHKGASTVHHVSTTNGHADCHHNKYAKTCEGKVSACRRQHWYLCSSASLLLPDVIPTLICIVGFDNS